MVKGGLGSAGRAVFGKGGKVEKRQGGLLHLWVSTREGTYATFAKVKPEEVEELLTLRAYTRGKTKRSIARREQSWPWLEECGFAEVNGALLPLSLGDEA